MDSLKKEILDFAQFISGIPQEEEHVSMDYKRLLYAPYAGSWQNEWVMQVYESVIQLLKQIQPQNRDVIEQRFKKIKHDYYELRNLPKKTSYGVGSQYERAYNKKYTTL